MYIIDTSVWIEIFLDTDKGKKSAQMIKEQTSIFTGNITIAEISKWCYLNNIKFDEILERIEKTSLILYTTRLSEQRAGQLCVQVNKKLSNKEKTVGLIDCIIAAIAEENDLTVLTKDRHFLKFEGVKKEII